MEDYENWDEEFSFADCSPGTAGSKNEPLISSLSGSIRQNRSNSEENVENWDEEFGLNNAAEEGKGLSDGLGLQHILHSTLNFRANVSGDNIPESCCISSQIISSRSNETERDCVLPTNPYSLPNQYSVDSKTFEDWLRCFVNNHKCSLERNINKRDLNWFDTILNRNILDCKLTKVDDSTLLLFVSFASPRLGVKSLLFFG